MTDRLEFWIVTLLKFSTFAVLMYMVKFVFEEIAFLKALRRQEKQAEELGKRASRLVDLAEKEHTEEMQHAKTGFPLFPPRQG